MSARTISLTSEFDALRREIELLRRRPVTAAVPLIDDVADLPSAPREDQRVDLLVSDRILELTWRGVLNGGAGAWAVSGDVIGAAQSPAGDRSTSGALPNGPSITMPARMVVRAWCFGSARRPSGGAGLSDLQVQLALNGSSVPSNITSSTTDAQWVGGTIYGSEGPAGRLINAGVTVSLNVTISGGFTWRFGDHRVWHLMIRPLELRP